MTRCWRLRLEDRLLGLKLNAAREYAELKDEVEQAIALKGEEYFRVECLKKVSQSLPEYPPGRPYYEELGEQRVAAGKYRSAIRYQSHMLPILRAIQDYASSTRLTLAMAGKPRPRKQGFDLCRYFLNHRLIQGPTMGHDR